MRPEPQIQQASRPTRHADTRRASIRPDDVAARRMAVQRHWNDAEGELAFSPDVQSSLRILWVYAGHEIAACESDPSDQAVGGLNAPTRNLPGSFGARQLERQGRPACPIDLPRVAAEVGSVRPGRVRNRTKTEPEEKVKKPTDGARKKSPPARKAPARGRYVDEYARPAGCD